MKVKVIKKPQKLHGWNKAYKSICDIYILDSFNKYILYDKKTKKFIAVDNDFDYDEERHTDVIEITHNCKTIKALKRRIRRNLVSLCGDFEIQVRNFRYKDTQYRFKLKC